MSNYIDGFILPIPKIHLEEYQRVAQQVAAIWKEHGALAYYEYVAEDSTMQGVRTFADAAGATADEAVVFGWTVFDSREARDEANQKVPKDPRMGALVGPLLNPERMIFNPKRMVYGGFEQLV